MALVHFFSRPHPSFESMRQKLSFAMFLQTGIGCQLSHLYQKTHVDSTQMMIQITVTNKTTVRIIILWQNKMFGYV